MRKKLDMLKEVVGAVQKLSQRGSIPAQAVINCVYSRVESKISRKRRINMEIRKSLALAVSKGLLLHKGNNYSLPVTKQTRTSVKVSKIKGKGKLRTHRLRGVTKMSGPSKKKVHDLKRSGIGNVGKRGRSPAVPRGNKSYPKRRKRQGTPLLPRLNPESDGEDAGACPLIVVTPTVDKQNTTNHLSGGDFNITQ